MENHFHKPRDIMGGSVIVITGLGFLLSGKNLEIGTTFRMGPGYFPMVLSILLIVLGCCIILQALRAARLPHDFDNVPWKGLLAITGSIILFGSMIRGIGLLPAAAGVIAITAPVSHYANKKTTVLLAVFFAIGSVLVFHYGLGLPLPMIGKWLSPAFWRG